MLDGNLIAIGGEETSIGRSYSNKVYTYSATANPWIYVSDLPAPKPKAAVAVLSSTEICDWRPM